MSGDAKQSVWRVAQTWGHPPVVGGEMEPKPELLNYDDYDKLLHRWLNEKVFEKLTLDKDYINIFFTDKTFISFRTKDHPVV